MTKPGKPRRNLLHFTLRGMEELAHFPAEASHRKALEELGGGAAKGWSLFEGIAITAAIGYAAFWIARELVRMAQAQFAIDIPRWTVDVVGTIFVVTTVFIWLRWIHQRSMRKSLREQLIALGVPVCLRCGYLLKGLPADTKACPECGGELSPEPICLLDHHAH